MRTTSRTARVAVAALMGLGACLGLVACGGSAGSTPAAPQGRTATAPPPDAAPPAAEPVSARTAEAGDNAGSDTGDTTTAAAASTPPVGAEQQPSGAVARETIYAELVEAWRATPAGFGMSYDKLTRLTGQEAIDYQKKILPDEEPFSDYYLNENPRLRNVVISPDAVIHGNQQLGPGSGTRTARLTPDQLVDRVQEHPRTLVKMVTQVVDGRVQVIRLDEIYMP